MARTSVGEFFQIVALAVTLALVVRPTFGGVTCKNLPTEYCAFSVSSTGTRCVLEKYVERTHANYECRSSDVMVESMIDWVETDECIEACGLTRKVIGISSDSLLEPKFTQKLCSPNCYQMCPNIVDLYFNLAAGEGVYLPRLCKMQRSESRRGMVEINSYGEEKAEELEGPSSALVPVPYEGPAYEPPYWWLVPPSMEPMYGEPLPPFAPSPSPVEPYWKP